jgi:hypothetical protein
MAVDIVSLSFEIDSSKIVPAVQALQQLGAQATVTQGQLDRMRHETDDLRDALEQFHRMMDRVRDMLVTVGVAFAGMRIGDVAKEATLAAARFETLGVVMSRIALNTNYSQAQLFEYAKGIQATGISMTEARQAVIQMIQSQLDLSQATKLARVAQDAAVVGNMNSTEAFMTLIHGIETLQTDTLRTVGINISLDDAYTRLAQTLNKSVGALTQQEKVQAAMNATIAAGVQIAGSYEAAMGTAGKQLNSMKRYVDDLLTTMGQGFLEGFTRTITQVVGGMKELQHWLDTPAGKHFLDDLSAIGAYIASNLIPAILALAVAIVTRLVAAFRLAQLTALASFAFMNPWVAAIMGVVGALTFLTLRSTESSRAIDFADAAIQRHEAATRSASSAIKEQSELEAQLVQRQKERALAEAQAAVNELQGETLRRTMTQAAGAAQQIIATSATPEVDASRIGAGRGGFPGLGVTPRGALPILTDDAGNFPVLSKSIISDKAIQAQIDALQKALSSTQTTQGLDQALQLILDIEKALKTSSQQNAPALIKQFDAMIDPLEKMKKRIEAATQELDKAKQAAADAGAQIDKVNHAIIDPGKFSAEALKAIESVGLHFDSLRGVILKSQQTAQDSRTNIETYIKALQDASKQQQEIIADPKRTDAERSQAVKNLADNQKTLNALLADQVLIYNRLAAAAESAGQKMFEDQRRAAQLIPTSTDPIQTARLRAQQQFQQQYWSSDGKFVGEPSDVAQTYRNAILSGVTLPSPIGLTPEQQARELQRAYGNEAARQQQQQQLVNQQQSTAEARIRAEYAAKIAAAEADGATAVQRLNSEMERLIEGTKAVQNYAALAAKSWEDQAKAIGDAVAKLRQMAQENENSRRLAEATLQGPGAVAAERLRQEQQKFLQGVIPGYAAPQLPGMPRLPGPMPGAGNQGTISLTPGGGGSYATQFAAVEKTYNLPSGLLSSIARRESSMNPNAVNPVSGAEGLMGILPSTARDPGYGVHGGIDAKDPIAAIEFAGAYIAALRKATGSLEAAIGRYSGGGYTLAAVSGRGAAPGGAPGGAGAMVPAIPTTPLGPATGPLTPEWERFFKTESGRQLGEQIFSPTRQSLADQVRSQKDALTLETAQEKAIFQTNAQRDRTVALAQRDLDYQKQLASAYTDEQKAFVTAQDAEIRKLIEKKAVEDELLDKAQQWRDATVGAADAISGAFESAVLKGENLKQTFVSLLGSIEDIIWKVTVTKPLENWMTSLLGASGIFSSAAGAGGAASAAGAVGGSLAFAAHGNVFSSPSLATFSNTVVSQPTFFKFAAGGGVMGEAGPEAILPLVRGPSGNLGVRGAGGGENAITVNTPITINNNGPGTANKTPDPAAMRAMQAQLTATVKEAIRATITDERRPGGQLWS